MFSFVEQILIHVSDLHERERESENSAYCIHFIFQHNIYKQLKT